MHSQLRAGEPVSAAARQAALKGEEEEGLHVKPRGPAELPFVTEELFE